MSLTGFLSLYLCWSVSPQQPPSVSRVVCQNIDFEQIAPHCPEEPGLSLGVDEGLGQ